LPFQLTRFKKRLEQDAAESIALIKDE